MERILKGYPVICEYCGYEYRPNEDIMKDIIPQTAPEPKNLYNPQDLINPLGNPRRPFQRPPIRFHNDSNQFISHRRPNRERFPINGPGGFTNALSKISETEILKNLKFNWISLKDFGNKIGVHDKREIYVLRMKINEMANRGLIDVDYKVNKILIRRRRN